MNGVPQYLEAMFSPQAEVDLISDFRAGFRVSYGIYSTYLRTIKSFTLHEEFKRRRHGLRLALNLQSIGRYGRFDPRLTKEEIDWVNAYANKPHNDVYGLAICTAYDF